MVGLFSAGKIFSIDSKLSFFIFNFRPTLLRASIAALSRIEIFSIFFRLKLSAQACLFAINLVVEVITVSSLYFGSAPAKFNFDFDAFVCEVFFCYIYKFS